jgi:hypothetical protein
MKSLPNSPGGAGALGLKNRTRQLQMSGPMLSNKNRRLTSSASSSNIPPMRQQNQLTQSHAAYNTVGQSNTGRVISETVALNTQIQGTETGLLGEATRSQQTNSSDLAKI